MTLGVFVQLYVLISIVCVAWTHMNSKIEERLVTNDKDVSDGSRMKRSLFTFSIRRALDGLKASTQLLDSATPFYSPFSGALSKYVKVGTYKTALDDFWSVNPTDIKKVVLPDGVKRRIGYVGDRVLILELRSRSGRILLKIIKGKGTKRERTKYIEYLKPLPRRKTSQ